MQALSKVLIATFVLIAAAGCTAEVEETGAPPDVDVQGGELPQVDVNPADVEISTDTQTVRVPEVNVEPSNP